MRNEEKCDIVISLNHVLQEDDEKQAQNVNGLDIILSGHDHIVLQEIINEIPIVKSGDDFSCLGTIHLYEKGVL